VNRTACKCNRIATTGLFFFNGRNQKQCKELGDRVKTGEDSYQGVAGNQGIASQNTLAWVETNTSL
jgi:hypothetical protein